MSNFQKYAAFYDLLYRDKDYKAEAEYVARKIRGANRPAQTILELGSGTGRHGRLLAGMGFDVHGIELSAEMVNLAKAATHPPLAGEGRFTCEVGDVCAVKLERTFDAVISLFHVISYQTTDGALGAAFNVAASHLDAGGVFLFDVWHGPAVLIEDRDIRVKEASDDRYKVRRTAHSELDSEKHTVKVRYEIDCEDKVLGEIFQFSEEHVMRYLMPVEIQRLATASGFTLMLTEEFLSGNPASSSTRGVCYLLQKLAA